MKTAQSWVFNCDSGCFADICEREAWTVGDILVIYQPHKSMKEYDELLATVFLKHTDKTPMKASMMKSLQSVNEAFLKSYNDVLDKTNNQWTLPCKGTVESIVQAKKPLHLEDGALKMTFEIRGATDGCCGDRWLPKYLAEWRGDTFEADDDADETFFQRCKHPALRAIV
jgi:hypothetical protein